jgi:type I restriction enzyme S subunit
MTLDLHKILPRTWALIQLGTLTETVETRNSNFAPDSEFFYIDITSIDNGLNKITSPKKYQWKNAPSRARQIVKENDIVFSTVRTYLMNIALVPLSLSGQIASTGFTVIRARKEINHKLLFYRTLSREFIEALNELQRGTSYPAVRDKDVFAQLIPLPPLAEQHRIVDKIEELFSDLDDGIASLKKAQQQLKVYRQAVLKWAFEGKLTAQWREEQKRQGKLESAETLLEQIKAEREQRYQEKLAQWQADVKAWEANGKVGKKPGKPSKTDDLLALAQEIICELPTIPSEWQWFKLGQLTDISGGVAKNSKRDILPLKLPYLRVANVYSNFLDLSEIHEITLKDGEVSRVLLQEGDLLIVEGNGSIDQIGRVALWNGKISPCVHQNHIIKARPSKALNGKYILYFLLSPRGRDFIKDQAATTSGLYTLSLSKVKALKVPLMSFFEQNKIVEEVESRLSICDSLEATITENLQRAEALRQSILKQAFEGKLVPQDPNDEPASVLLERIRKTRNQNKQLNLNDL